MWLFEQARKPGTRNTRILLKLGVAYGKNNSTKDALQVYDFIKDYDLLSEMFLQKIKLLGRGPTIKSLKKQQVGTASQVKSASSDENSWYFEAAQEPSAKPAD